MSYTAWSVVFGEQPTAAKWNQLGQNDAGFKDGTNIDNDAILTRHILNKNITTSKMKPNYSKLVGDNGGSTRQAINTSTPTLIQGTQFTYTTGNTTELLIIDAVILMTEAADSNTAIFVNGTRAGNDCYKSDKTYTSVCPFAFFEAAANTTYTIEARAWGSALITVANTISDRTGSNPFGPEIHLLAFAR